MVQIRVQAEDGTLEMPSSICQMSSLIRSLYQLSPPDRILPLHQFKVAQLKRVLGFCQSLNYKQPCFKMKSDRLDQVLPMAVLNWIGSYQYDTNMEELDKLIELFDQLGIEAGLEVCAVVMASNLWFEDKQGWQKKAKKNDSSFDLNKLSLKEFKQLEKLYPIIN